MYMYIFYIDFQIAPMNNNKSNNKTVNENNISFEYNVINFCKTCEDAHKHTGPALNHIGPSA